LVARVTCDGVDVGAKQVSAGMAWVSEELALDGSLYRLQDAARGAGAGLWKDPSPLAPWEWRRAKRSRDVKVDGDSRAGRR
jgi:endonuclease YncB( thermonuclease family)